MRPNPALLATLLAAGAFAMTPGRAAAQAEGAIAGPVRERESARPLGGAELVVDDRVGTLSDTAGLYRVRGVPGWHRVAARLIGFRGMVLDSVFVRAGATAAADFIWSPTRFSSSRWSSPHRWTRCWTRWPPAPSRRSARRTSASSR